MTFRDARRLPRAAAPARATGPLPVAERAAAELVSLPMFPHMTDAQADYVCDALTEALQAVAAGPELSHAG